MLHQGSAIRYAVMVEVLLCVWWCYVEVLPHVPRPMRVSTTQRTTPTRAPPQPRAHLPHHPPQQDSHSRLQTDLERARREGFLFGAKLVRGAYMQLERQRALDRGYPSPIMDTADDTHRNYDRYDAFWWKGGC